MSSNCYCPRKILRVVSNGLLQDMFEIHRIAIDIDWDEVTETKIEPIFLAWQSLAERPRRTIELLLRDVNSMANEVGQRAIFEEAHRQGETELIEELSQYDSRYDVAMWTALKKADVWDNAVLLNRADKRLGGRLSQRRINVPTTAKPKGTMETMQSLSKSLSAFFTLHQGLGRNCQCEYLLRSDGTHYVFATLDVLLDPKFRFPTNPADGIRSLCVDEARVRVLGTKDNLTLEPGEREKPTNFSDMIEKYLDDQKVPRSVMQVLRAVMLFSWEDSDGRVREFDVRITRQNRSNLKSLAQEERELAEKYLRE